MEGGNKVDVPGTGESRPTRCTWRMALLRDANPSQAEAIVHDHDREGPLLVLAGAGSGKTTVLAGRMAYLMGCGVPPAAVVALTFTRDAAGEMRSRVERRAGELGLAGSGTPLITTFHGLAYRIVRAGQAGEPNWRRLGFSRRPRLMEEAERRALLRQAASRLGLDAEKAAEMLPADCGWEPGSAEKGGPEEGKADRLGAWHRAREAGLPAAGGQGDGDGAGEALHRLRGEYAALARAGGKLAFSDMVPAALELLRRWPAAPAGLGRELAYFLVDEFQDTSPDQLELLALLAGGRPNVFLVGDDDQAIYSFRGADSRCLEAAFRRFPGLRVVKLEINYRSSREIVRYANSVFADKPAALRKTLVAGRTGHPMLLRNQGPRILVHAHGRAQGRWLAREARRLRGAYGLRWRDFALLFRINALEPYYRDLVRSFAGDEAAGEMRFMTVHAAKGLQFPVVFFVGLEEGICPYKDALSSGDPEKLLEERRIFYVGVTRAEFRLYLCCSRLRVLRGRVRRQRPSRFLRANIRAAIRCWFAGCFGEG